MVRQRLPLLMVAFTCLLLFTSCSTHTASQTASRTAIQVNHVIAASLLQGSHIGDWPLFGYDPGHTGYVDAAVQARPIQGKVSWTRQPGSLFSSPIAGQGLVYIASTDGNLYALRQDSGAIVWHTHINSYLTDATPALEGKVLFVAEEGTTLAALNALTGARYWAVPLAEKIQAPPLVVGSRVLVASLTTLWVLDAASGRLLWKYHYGAVGWPTTASPTVVGTTVYFGSGSSTKLWALNLLNGHVLWSFDTHDRITGAAIVQGQMVYVATWQGTIFALARTTGALRWSYALNRGQQSVVDGVGGSMALADNRLYAGDYRGAIICLDAASGKLEWRYATGAQVLATPIIAAGRVYIGSDDGYFYALDMRTGRPAWRYATGAVRASAALATGLLYVGSLNGTLYAFS
jgi:outer membrane protein assembly factor BamB